MMRKPIRWEHVKIDAKDWICVCGNTPWAEGFYPCDERGNIVFPTPEEWTTTWNVCDRCGRIIDQASLRVVAMRHPDACALRQKSGGAKKTYELLYREHPDGDEPPTCYVVEAADEDELLWMVSLLVAKPVTMREIEILNVSG
jgi:hypothetical protein